MKTYRRAETCRTLLIACGLAVLGAMAGLVINRVHPRRLALHATRADLAADAARAMGFGRASPDQAAEAVRDHTHIILDARSWPDYREGHIPGAISLPPAAFIARFPTVQFMLDVQQPVLIYGAGPDDEAPLRLGELLREQGYREINMLAEGWDGWRAAGHPVEHGTGPL